MAEDIYIYFHLYIKHRRNHFHKKTKRNPFLVNTLSQVLGTVCNEKAVGRFQMKSESRLKSMST